MSLFALINGKGIELRDFQMSFTQDEIPTFDVTLPTRDIAGQDLYLEDISIYRDDILIIDGIIKSPNPYPELLESASNPLFTSLKCDNHLGRLAIEAGQIVHFQNVLVSVAITTLLAGTELSSWLLNDTSTLNDIEVTVDLRGRENLWSQIQEVCKQSRNATFVRYGGFNGTEYLLDVGYFRERVNTPKAVWGDNIISPPRFQESDTEPIKYLYPISGSSSDMPVDLDRALNLDPTLDDISQDYQIIVGTGKIRNNNIVKGKSVRLSFDTIKTANDVAPTGAELDETALALYRSGAETLEASESTVSLSVKITCEDAPAIHDAIWLESKIFEEKYDLYTEEFEVIESFDISGYFRIVGITADLRDRFEVYNPYIEDYIGNAVYELELVQGDKRVVKSANDILLEKAQKTDVFDDIVGLVSGGILGISNVTVQHDTVAADCNYTGVLDGKEFEFVVPSPPVGATDVIVTIKDIDPTNYTIKTTQFATLLANHILCVQNSNTLDWDASDDCEIVASFIFI